MNNICRICNSNNIKTLFTRNFLNTGVEIILDKYNVSVCCNCGFGFASNIPDQAFFNEYYKTNSKYEGFVNYRANSKQSRIVVATHIDKYILDKKQSILDIGCANGDLLLLLKEKGYKNLIGVDPSPTCAENIGNLGGIDGRCASFDQLDDSYSSDVILVMSVLEHICDLHGFVERISKILNPRGVLFVEVPDVSLFNVNGSAPFQEFSMEHINYFSEKSLSMLLSKFGIVLCETLNLSSGSMLYIFKKDYDGKTENLLISYIENSKYIESEIIKKIMPYWGKKIIMWGLGTFGRYLLAEKILTKCDIGVIIDQNPHYSNANLKFNDQSIQVQLPQMIESSDVPIIITTQVYQNEIVNLIKNDFHLKNPLVLLF